MLLRHQLLHGNLSRSTSITRIVLQRTSFPSSVLLFSRIPSDSLQIRLKSKKRKKSSNPEPLPSPAQPFESVSTSPGLVDSTLQKAQNSRFWNTYEAFESHIRNWHTSPYFLSCLINFLVLVIFAKWTLEAMASHETAPEDQNAPPSEKGMWVPAGTGKKRFLTPGQMWMLDNFTCTPINMADGRVWTVVTSTFSHQLGPHAFINMAVTHYLFAGLCPLYGTPAIAVVFLLSGVLGNYAASLLQKSRGKEYWEEKYPAQFWGSLGSSAANFGVLGFGAALNPDQRAMIWGIVPMTLRRFVFIWWAFEIFQWTNQTGSEKIRSSVCPPLLISFTFLSFAECTA